MPPDKRRGPAANRAPQRSDTTKHQITPTVACDRVRKINWHRRICAELEQLAPLTRYYGPRPLWAVPLAQVLDEGWWRHER